MLFVYLARRDKRGVRLLILGNGELSGPVKFDEAVAAGLDLAWVEAIKPHIQASKLDAEVWMESAPSFPDLVARLKRRGYRVDAFQTPVAWVRTKEPSDRGVFTPGDRAADISTEVLKRLEVRMRAKKLGG